MLSLCRCCWFDWFWYLCSVFQVWRHQNFRLYFLYLQWQQKKNKWFLAILASKWPCEHPVPGFLPTSKTCPVGSPLRTPSQQRWGHKQVAPGPSLYCEVSSPSCLSSSVSSWYRAGMNVIRLCTSCPQHTCVSYLCPTIPTAFFCGFSFCLLAEC